MPARVGGITRARGRGSKPIHRACGNLADVEWLRTWVVPGLYSGLGTTLAHSTPPPTPHKGQDSNPTRGNNGPTRAPQGHTRGPPGSIDGETLRRQHRALVGALALACVAGVSHGDAHKGLCGALAALWRSSRALACVGFCGLV